MKTYVFRAELEQDDDGRWSTVVPSLPGCATWGLTREEALDSLQEAAQAYLEVLVEDGHPLPAPEENIVQVIQAPAVAVVLRTSVLKLHGS